MPASDTLRASTSAKALTLTAYAAFFPIGVVTVLLGPMLPTLSARWSLNHSQSGAVINTQYLASTCAVALSGVLVSRWGYRFAMKAGLLLASAGAALLLSGPKIVGIVCIAAYGAGLGLAVPAANLLVAAVNSSRRSAALNVLNFCWSAGAVACPLLVAVAAKQHHLPLLLGLIAGFMLLVFAGIVIMPSSIVEPSVVKNAGIKKGFGIDWKHAALPALGALFFVYVGTENGFGLWVATYAKSLGNLTVTMALMTPSFFYAALTLGRWLAPFFLKTMDEVRLAQVGLLVSCAGMAGLIVSHTLPGVLVSTSLAGLGLSSVYPITIASLSREFGPAASRIGSLMFTLSNLGGGFMPWMVGISSTRFGTLKAGLAMPLLGSAVMYLLYLRDWKPEAAEQTA